MYFMCCWLAPAVSQVLLNFSHIHVVCATKKFSLKNSSYSASFPSLITFLFTFYTYLRKSGDEINYLCVLTISKQNFVESQLGLSSYKFCRRILLRW